MSTTRLGKHTKNDGKIHHAIFMGKSTISTGPLSIAMSMFVYRVTIFKNTSCEKLSLKSLLKCRVHAAFRDLMPWIDYEKNMAISLASQMFRHTYKS